MLTVASLRITALLNSISTEILSCQPCHLTTVESPHRVQEDHGHRHPLEERVLGDAHHQTAVPHLSGVGPHKASKWLPPRLPPPRRLIPGRKPLFNMQVGPTRISYSHYGHIRL